MPIDKTRKQTEIGSVLLCNCKGATRDRQHVRFNNAETGTTGGQQSRLERTQEAQRSRISEAGISTCGSVSETAETHSTDEKGLFDVQSPSKPDKWSHHNTYRSASTSLFLLHPSTLPSTHLSLSPMSLQDGSSRNAAASCIDLRLQNMSETNEHQQVSSFS